MTARMTIIIESSDKKTRVELTEFEAQQVYEALRRFLDHQPAPAPIIVPVYPYVYPPYPPWPQVTWTVSAGGTTDAATHNN